MGADAAYDVCGWLLAGASVRTAIGYNFVEAKEVLRRGDGVIGSRVRREDEQFSYLFQGDAHVDVFATDHIVLRAGWQVMWIMHFQEAVDQVDFDLSPDFLTKKYNGQAFYHGPLVELQIIF